MNRFRFRLGSVLKVREAQEESRKREFGAAVGHLTREETRYQEIEKNIEATDKVREESGKGKITIRNLINGFFFSLSLEKSKSDQRKEVDKAKTVVETKRKDLIEARRKKKIIEKLQEHELENYTRALIKEEQSIIDESSVLQYKPPEKQ